MVLSPLIASLGRVLETIVKPKAKAAQHRSPGRPPASNVGSREPTFERDEDARTRAQVGEALGVSGPTSCAECGWSSPVRGRRKVCVVVRRRDRHYRRGVDLVLDHGGDLEAVAAGLRLCPRLLALQVENARFNMQALAEIEAEDGRR